MEYIALVIYGQAIRHVNRAGPENRNRAFRNEIVGAKTQRVGHISHLKYVLRPNRAVGGICFNPFSRKMAQRISESLGKEQGTGLVAGRVPQRRSDSGKKGPVFVDVIIKAPSK